MNKVTIISERKFTEQELAQINQPIDSNTYTINGVTYTGSELQNLLEKDPHHFLSNEIK